MKARSLAGVLVVAGVALLASGCVSPPAGGPDGVSLAQLAGQWTLASVTFNGERFAPDPARDVTMTFAESEVAFDGLPNLHAISDVTIREGVLQSFDPTEAITAMAGTPFQRAAEQASLAIVNPRGATVQLHDKTVTLADIQKSGHVLELRR